MQRRFKQANDICRIFGINVCREFDADQLRFGSGGQRLFLKDLQVNKKEFLMEVNTFWMVIKDTEATQNLPGEK